MDADVVIAALAAEAAAFTGAVTTLSTMDWSAETRCPPWRVRDLVAHVRAGLARVPAMLAAPPVESATLVDAAGYFRPDHRYDAATNAARVAAAQAGAAGAPGMAAADLASAWRATVAAAREVPQGRVVQTRHGDAMPLTEYLLTRVVEVAVHGLDLADTLPRPCWLTEPAATVVLELLFGPQWTDVVHATGWDEARLLRAATGRADPGPLDALNLRRLTLG